MDQVSEAEKYEAEQLEEIENSLTGRTSDMECMALACPDLLRRGWIQVFEYYYIMPITAHRYYIIQAQLMM